MVFLFGAEGGIYCRLDGIDRIIRIYPPPIFIAASTPRPKQTQAPR